MRPCARAGVRRDVTASVEEDVKDWIFTHGFVCHSCSWLCGAKCSHSARTAATVPGTRPRCCARMLGCGRSQRGSHQKLSPSTWSAITYGTSQRVPSVTWSACGTCTCPTTASTRLPLGPCNIWGPSYACWTSHIIS